VFRQVGPRGTLAAEAFRLGSTAQDSDDRILFDPATGRLFYDADGAGGAGAVLFARLAKGLAPGAADFVVA
jgi:serralysin